MTKFAIDTISISLADQIASQALSLSHTLTQLCLYVRPADGITILESALKLVPEGEFEPDSYEVKAGKTGSIGSTYLTNSQALAACYAMRVLLGGYRPFGAEVIQAALPARSAIEKTLGQILLIDWSSSGWNSELMAIVNRYQALVLSISRGSAGFTYADEHRETDEYIQLIRESLIPGCHKIASQLIRSYLPIIAEARATILEDASKTLVEFDRLWAIAQMPLIKFAMLKSFQNLPGKTRELLLSKVDLADVRDGVPEIFASFASGLKSPNSRTELMNSIDESNHYSLDNFRMVSPFADLIDYLKASHDFAGLDSLVMLNYAEMILTIDLIKIDVIEHALELDEAQFSQPLRKFYEALVFTATKLSYSNGQLINEVRGVEPNSEGV